MITLLSKRLLDTVHTSVARNDRNRGSRADASSYSERSDYRYDAA